MPTSMKHGILYDPFQCKLEIAFFKVIFLLQMTYLGYFMSDIKYGNFINRLYYLLMNIKATIKNTTYDFCINFRYVFVHEKTTLSMECQKMYNQEGF